MRTMRWVLMAALAAAAAGCGSVVVQPWPGDAAVADTPPTPDTPPPPPDVGRTCTSSADCNAGEECYIAAGCGVPSYCGPGLGRPCTDDLATFCGCDGQTFSSSSSCPSRTYAHRGPCEGVDGGPVGCTFPDGRVCPFGQTCPAGDGCNSCACGRDGTIACTGLACVDAGPPACVFPDGRVCPVGQRCPAPDGCNVCVCAPGGALSCTERACVDAGPPPACELPDGRTCPVGATCAVDRCTVCFCGAPGMLGCTNMCADAGPPVDVPAPGSCRNSSDCPRSMVCDGPPGCGVRWSCVPPRPCTADVAPFCGCDGVTFYGSSTCPGQMYQSRGACPGADGGTVVCRAQDARGEGACDGFFGYAWNGMTCVGITGCRCVGADCPSLLRDPAACRARYAGCRG